MFSFSKIKRQTALSALFAMLAGCQTAPTTLYHWGQYQPQVYAYFKGDGASIEEQRGKLESEQQLAAASGAALPPGFNAHLGLLYLQSGNLDKAKTLFQTEEAQFPESKQYMDFLMRNMTTPTPGKS